MYCHPERSEGSVVAAKCRTLASLGMTKSGGHRRTPLLNRINKGVMNLGAAPADWGHLSICIFWRIEGIFVKIFRLLIPFFSLSVAAAQPSLQPPAALTLPLREGWTVQSSAKVTATGEAISGAAFKTAFNT